MSRLWQTMQELMAPIVLSDDESAEAEAEPCEAPLLVPLATDPPAKRRCSGASRKDTSETASPRSEASECDEFVFEDDGDCEDFIPKGALRGDAAAAAALAALAVAKPRPPPGALRALLPVGGLSASREVCAADVLSKSQTEAVQLVAREARPKSQSAEKALDRRLQQWGYKAGQLGEVLAYIRDEAPIIIHIDLAARWELLGKDTHYRNQFETGSTKGSNNLDKRKSWEDRLFPGSYSGAKPFDRPKYGVLNAVNDPRGIASVGSQYGKDYLVLRGVRLRTTFSDKDSCNANGHIASCEWYAHVLEQYNDLELRAVAQVALGERPFADSAVLETAAGGYKEVQIHGELQLANHIESVVVHPSRMGTSLEPELRAWCKTVGCQFQCMASCQDGPASSDMVVDSVAIGESFLSTPVWRWCLPLHAETWLRFDIFGSTALEDRYQGKTFTMPAFPVGRVVSVDIAARAMVVEVDAEEVALILKRGKSPDRSAEIRTASSKTPAPKPASAKAKAKEARKSVPAEKAKVFVWEYGGSATGEGGWTAYDSEISTVLERAFQSSASEISLNIGATKYKVNLPLLKQINSKTGFVRMMRRSFKPFSGG